MASLDTSDLRNDDALWQLLGHARRAEASPCFVRKVLREVEEISSPQPAWWLRWLRTVAPAAVCAGIAALAIVGAGQTPVPQNVAGSDLEFETIQNLDMLVSSYESSIWLDPSLP